MFVEETDLSVTIPERHVILAQQLDVHGIAMRLGQIAADQKGNPEATKNLSHRCSGSDTADEIVVVFRQHRALLRSGRPAFDGRLILG